MLEMLGKGILHAMHQYVKVNNNHMNDYDKKKESSYHKYCNVNNLHG